MRRTKSIPIEFDCDVEFADGIYEATVEAEVCVGIAGNMVDPDEPPTVEEMHVWIERNGQWEDVCDELGAEEYDRLCAIAEESTFSGGPINEPDYDR